MNQGMFKFKVARDRLMMATDISSDPDHKSYIHRSLKYDEGSKIMINAFRKQATWNQVAFGYDRDPKVPSVQDYVHIDIPYEALEALAMATGQFKPLDFSYEKAGTFTAMPELTAEEREIAISYGGKSTNDWPISTLEEREARINTHNMKSEGEKARLIAELEEKGIPYKTVQFQQTARHLSAYGHTVTEIHAGGLITLQDAFDNGGVKSEAFRDYIKGHFREVPITPNI